MAPALDAAETIGPDIESFNQPRISGLFICSGLVHCSYAAKWPDELLKTVLTKVTLDHVSITKNRAKAGYRVMA